jgi:hypothetical protein
MRRYSAVTSWAVMGTFAFIRSRHEGHTLVWLHLEHGAISMAAERTDNVIALAPYRMARLAQGHRPRPYLMWYPNVGFVPMQAASAPTPVGHIRTAHGNEPA